MCYFKTKIAELLLSSCMSVQSKTMTSMLAVISTEEIYIWQLEEMSGQNSSGER